MTFRENLYARYCTEVVKRENWKPQGKCRLQVNLFMEDRNMSSRIERLKENGILRKQFGFS